jgi:hypothetical protein
MFRPGDAVIWLAERELTTELEELQLKGFDETPSA